MNIVAILGSPRPKGNSSLLAKRILDAAAARGARHGRHGAQRRVRLARLGAFGIADGAEVAAKREALVRIFAKPDAHADTINKCLVITSSFPPHQAHWC